MASSFPPAERQTLAALCGTLAPEARGESGEAAHGRIPSDSERNATDVEELVRTALPPHQQSDFRRFLKVVDSRATNLLLMGRPVRFLELSPDRREEYLRSWSRSRLEVKRRGFAAIKRLALYAAYAPARDDTSVPGSNETGYRLDVGSEDSTNSRGTESDLTPIRPDRETELRTDVVVVGAGAGGSVIAAELSRSGHQVLVLEAGPYRSAETFPKTEREAYRTLFDRQALLTTRDSSIVVLAGRGAGGSTTVNWMTCLRPPTWLIDEWVRASAGGLDPRELSHDVDDVWARLHVSLEESQVNPANEVLRQGCLALGYRSPEDFALIARNALGCRERCGPCTFGCRFNAKRSALVTYLADAQTFGTKFLFDTEVDHLLVDGDRTVGVDGTFRGRSEPIPIRVRSRVVVLAAGAVHTPAVLARSGVRFPALGQGLRLHPTTAVVGEFAHRIEPWSGPTQTIVVRRFQKGDGTFHGPWLENAPVHPALAAVAFPWEGRSAHRDRMARLAHVAATIALVRDVGYGTVRVDADGASELDYRLARADRRHLTDGMIEAGRIQAAAGASRLSTLHTPSVEVERTGDRISPAEFAQWEDRVRARGIRESTVGLYSAHPTGSARWGTDPRTSTTAASGECHHLRNLWMGDGSLFPSAPGINPMILIMATARRTARNIHSRLRNGEKGTPSPGDRSLAS